MKNFYVYVYIDPRNDCVFYVGKGKGRRLMQHMQPNHLRNNTLKNNKIKKLLKIGMHPIIKKVYENLSEEDAFRLEIQLINEYQETLTNVSSGGVGGDQMSGKICINNGISNKFIFEDEFINYSDWIIGKIYKSKETKDLAISRMKSSSKLVGKVACKNLFGENILVESDEYYNNRHLYKTITKENSVETKKKKSESMTGLIKTESHRLNLSKAAKLQFRIYASCIYCLKKFDLGNYTRHINAKPCY